MYTTSLSGGFYVSLGQTALRVSRVCLGTMTFGNPTSEPESTRLINHALDHGVNLFDTSNAYEGYDRSFHSSGGVAEELLGRGLAARRHEAVICTKFANPIGSGPLDAGLSARHLERELYKSLKRLGTDYIDLVLAHRWDEAASMDQLLTVFDRWVRSGKVLAVGVSNWPVWRIAQACERTDQGGHAPLSVSSPKYNLLCRGIELEHAPCAAAYGLALLVYQPFEGGILAGRYRRGHSPPASSRAADMPKWLPQLGEQLFDRLEALEMMAREIDLSMVEYASAWVLSRPFVSSVIVGVRAPSQLDKALRGASATLPPEHLTRIDALFPPPSPRSGEAVLAWREDGWRLTEFEQSNRTW